MKRLLPVFLLAGCSHVHMEGGGELALLVGIALVSAGIYESEYTGITSNRAVPELDPTRKVSEQDCTKPLDYSLGNIRCK